MAALLHAFGTFLVVLMVLDELKEQCYILLRAAQTCRNKVCLKTITSICGVLSVTAPTLQTSGQSFWHIFALGTSREMPVLYWVVY